MATQTSAGVVFAISTALPATYTAAGYGALTFTTVGEVTDIGEFGDEYAEVTHLPLSSARVQKFAGSVNSGSATIQMAVDFAEAGQDLMRAAPATRANHAFCITLQDGTKQYNVGRVMSYKVTIGGADAMVSASANVGFNGEWIED